MRLLTILLLRGLCLAGEAPPGPRDVVAGVFLGQLYPSGKVYVQGFGDGPPAEWPKQVSLRGAGAASGKVPEGWASFLKPMAGEQVHIPRVEGMGDRHDSCNKGSPTEPEPGRAYLTEDLFDVMMPHCDGNEGVAVYKAASPGKVSALVVAARPGVRLGPNRARAGEARPLTKAERAEVERLKKKTPSGEECTGEPRFKDSARQLFAAAVEGTRLSIRVSTYRNPGCSGHMGAIYILDVLRDGEPLESAELIRPMGVL